MSDYEPPAEVVEALVEDYKRHAGYLMPLRLAKFVLRRQHERESRLVAGIVRAQEWLSVGSMDTAQHELSETRVWYNKLDAPKVPTLLEAVEQIERECPGRVIATLKDSQAWTIIKLAAVERAEKSG